MKRDNIIVLTKDEITETWGSLTECCREHTEFPYHSLKTKKFPFNWEGWTFTKVPHRKKIK